MASAGWWAASIPSHLSYVFSNRSSCSQVGQRRSYLLNYLLFLRLTPVLPNTFINVASPMVGVPLPHFALATLLGCAPNNFMASKVRMLRVTPAYVRVTCSPMLLPCISSSCCSAVPTQPLYHP